MDYQHHTILLLKESKIKIGNTIANIPDENDIIMKDYHLR